MLYALFHKGLFFKFYLNWDTNDKNFVNNLLSPLGFSRSDVKIIAYKATMRNDQSFFFDTELDDLPVLVFAGQEMMDFDDGEGGVIQKPVMKSLETFEGTMVFPEA